MKHSIKCIELIKKTRAFLPTMTKQYNGYYYIGYGRRVGKKLIDIKVSRKESLIILEKDLKRISKNLSNKLSVVLTQNQFDACVSLIYDIGIKAFISSRILENLNSGDYSSIPSLFRKWNRYKKQQVYSLVKARKEELILFDKPME